MRVRIDENRCQGHALCAMTAPAVFRLREDDGHSFVDSPEVPVGEENSVVMAARTCPEQAITVEP